METEPLARFTIDTVDQRYRKETRRRGMGCSELGANRRGQVRGRPRQGISSTEPHSRPRSWNNPGAGRIDIDVRTSDALCSEYQMNGSRVCRAANGHDTSRRSASGRIAASRTIAASSTNASGTRAGKTGRQAVRLAIAADEKESSFEKDADTTADARWLENAGVQFGDPESGPRTSRNAGASRPRLPAPIALAGTDEAGQRRPQQCRSTLSPCPRMRHRES
jgi:hypothetical protein